MTWVDGLSDRELSKSQLASLRRLEKKATMTVAMEMDDALAEALEQIHEAIQELQVAVLGLPAPVVNVPAPIVNVPPLELPPPPPEDPKLGLLMEAVQAVSQLHPGPSATEIAMALASVITPGETVAPTVMTELLEQIKLLNFRIQGMGGGVARASGGGAVTLAQGQTVATTADAATNSSVTSVAASTSAVTLLAANSQRRAAYIHNDSSAIAYVKFGAAASTSSFTFAMPANSFYEVPTRPTWTGLITAVWASATGNARLTELSA